jgi:hypothetical protein
MELEEIFTSEIAKTVRIERRIKFNKEDSDWLDKMKNQYDIDPSVLVRMAVNFLKPRFTNHGASEESIVRVYRDHYSKK